MGLNQQETSCTTCSTSVLYISQSGFFFMPQELIGLGKVLLLYQWNSKSTHWLRFKWPWWHHLKSKVASEVKNSQYWFHRNCRRIKLANDFAFFGGCHQGHLSLSQWVLPLFILYEMPTFFWILGVNQKLVFFLYVISVLSLLLLNLTQIYIHDLTLSSAFVEGGGAWPPKMFNLSSALWIVTKYCLLVWYLQSKLTLHHLWNDFPLQMMSSKPLESQPMGASTVCYKMATFWILGIIKKQQKKSLFACD